ncbi:hypothetical protein H9I45_00990 [Polaribacter haliotis]|uniref:RNA polymerase sigma factor n=1 Tax=Polaribacter haliotis TaxID=1888915 RepID=A0A7L8AGA7_9FLAO|nr:sigma factor [Polaribacter haliotis]QOD61046.1 hypothetical protein H9I45_00990 [Polaribacter haliotis]
MDKLNDLIIRLKQKDIEAFKELHFKYCESINGVINTILTDENIAEEITQQVFLHVWNNSEDYSAKKGRFFTWILNIAKNKAVESLHFKSNIESKLKSNKYPIKTILDSNNAVDKKNNRILNLIYSKG